MRGKWRGRVVDRKERNKIEEKEKRGTEDSNSKINYKLLKIYALQANALPLISCVDMFLFLYPSSWWAGKRRAWYPLFEHAKTLGNYHIISVQP